MFLRCRKGLVLKRASQSQPEGQKFQKNLDNIEKSTLEENGPRLGPSSTKLERSRPSEDEDEELSEFLFWS